MQPLVEITQLRAFVEVVRQGTFTTAAASLGVRPSTISRKVAELEDRLGVQLLYRTTRQVTLSEAGRVLSQRCARGLDILRDAEREVLDVRTGVRGTLRITAPTDLGSEFLAPAIHQFLDAHPECSVEVILEDRLLDLARTGMDLALRTNSSDAKLTYPIGRGDFIVCASPNYLEQRGTPADLAELSRHECIVYAGGASAHFWRLTDGRRKLDVPVDGRLSINSLGMVRQAAVHGRGIALLPALLCEGELSNGRLRRILPAWAARSPFLYAVVPETQYLPAKTEAFVTFLTTYAARVLEASRSATSLSASGA